MKKIEILLFLLIAIIQGTPPDFYTEKLVFLSSLNTSALWMLHEESNGGRHGCSMQRWSYVSIDVKTGVLRKELRAEMQKDVNSGDWVKAGSGRDVATILSDAMKHAPRDAVGHCTTSVEYDYENSAFSYSNPSENQFVMHFKGKSKKLTATKVFVLNDSAYCPPCQDITSFGEYRDESRGAVQRKAALSLSISDKHISQFQCNDEEIVFNIIVLFDKENWKKTRSYLYNAIGLDEYKKKNYDGAISFFDDAYRTDTTNAQALFNAACCYALKGEVDSAITHLKFAAKIKSMDWVVKKVAKDSDFDAVRSSEKFQNFLNGVAQ